MLGQAGQRGVPGCDPPQQVNKGQNLAGEGDRCYPSSDPLKAWLTKTLAKGIRVRNARPAMENPIQEDGQGCAEGSCTPELPDTPTSGRAGGQGPCAEGRGAAGTHGALGKELLLLILSQQPGMSEPAFSWAEMSSQQNLRNRRTSPGAASSERGFLIPWCSNGVEKIPWRPGWPPSTIYPLSKACSFAGCLSWVFAGPNCVLLCPGVYLKVICSQ